MNERSIVSKAPPPRRRHLRQPPEPQETNGQVWQDSQTPPRRQVHPPTRIGLNGAAKPQELRVNMSLRLYEIDPSLPEQEFKMQSISIYDQVKKKDWAQSFY